MSAVGQLVFSLFVSTFVVNVPCKCSLICNVSDAGVRNVNVFGKLVMAHVFLSPGSYDVLESYPNAGSNTAKRSERLTQAGRLNQYDLGEWLLKRYENFLPMNYFPDCVLVRSSNSDKALESVECVLATLFRPDWENLKVGLNWQPVPIHALPQDLDELHGGRPCERYESVLRKYLNSPEVEKIDRENSELYKNLSKLTGKKIVSIGDVAGLYETLEAEASRNETLPEWVSDYFPSKLIKFSVLNYLIPTYTYELKRLKTGPFLNELARHAEGKVSGLLDPNWSLFIYSVNEDTLASILNGLGIFNCLPPPRSAAVLLELWDSDDQNFSVTVSYKNETNGDPYILRLPSCLRVCPLDTFLDTISKSTPQNWKKECMSDEEMSEIAVLKTVCVFIVLLMITLTIVLVRLCINRNKGRRQTRL